MTNLWLSFAILSASFFGSWHCAAMCAPVATLMAQRNSLVSYHLGRGLSYVLLGALGGALGEIFLSSQFIWLRWLAALTLAATLIAMGMALIKPRWQWPSSHRLSQSLAKIFRRGGLFRLNHSGFAVGLLTALLPCGWLYTFVLAAVATKSPWSGALTLFVFWLGGLPALSAVPSMVKATVGSASQRQQKIAGGILVFAGLYSLTSFFFMHGL